MKRFNFEEFLWFFVLTSLDLWIIYLTKTNKINFYIGANIIKYIYIAIIMLTIIAIFQIKNIFTCKSNRSIKLKLIPIILALILGIISIYKFQTFKHTELGKELIENKSSIIDNQLIFEHEVNKNNKEKLNIDKEKTIIVDENNPIILEDIRINPEKYAGKKLEIHGFVCKESYLNKNQFIIGRIIMTCCAADSKVVGIIGEYDKAKDLGENDRIKVSGTVGNSYIKDENNVKHSIPVIKIDELQKEN